MIFEFFRRLRRNGDLFRKVATQIEQHPDDYDQCGSKKCVGGWALAMSGVDYPGRCKYIWNSSAREDGSPVHLTAQSRLGLTDREAYILFGPKWRPADGLDVPHALRMLADGVCIDCVTWDVLA